MDLCNTLSVTVELLVTLYAGKHGRLDLYLKWVLIGRAGEET